MIDKAKKILQNEMFHPRIIGLFFNPFYIIRKGLYNAIYQNRKYISGKLLDFGCGSKPYKKIFTVKEYIGLDIAVSGHEHKDSQIDVFYDGKTIPFENNSFDSIFSSEVFEHVFNLDEMCYEIYRVLKPGGHLVITAPLVWDEHEAPYDFWRYTSFGIRHVLSKAWFKIVKVQKTTRYVETIFQMFSAYIYQIIIPKNKYMKLLLTPFIVAPVNILGIVLNFILPKSDIFYHDNLVVAKKI